MAAPLDYAHLGFKAGLEIHQQLDTPKLFCRCPSRLDETEKVDVDFQRQLHPTASELGEIDRAVLEEARKALRFEYLGERHTACLVEMDEEPPHALGAEALEAALQMSLLLRAKPVDEVHVMRKIVVDGSNTSGFQRTSLLATEGHVEAKEGRVRMATFCLEEDSARRLDRVGNLQRYRLDRLGIPLVEIATEPDIKGPAHAREVAEAIGSALRATGKAKRGIGTIRQDVNVSIREGARVEIKGVQELRLIEPAVEWEVRRQVHLLDVKKELLARGAKESDYQREIADLTEDFRASAAKMIASAIKAGQGVHGVRLPHLAGFLGKKSAEELPPPRVGRELADYAKVKAGVKGIFHSDELPAYGIEQVEVDAVRQRLGCGPHDAFALVVEKREVAEVALRGVLQRAAMLLHGVPEETRDLNPDATSRYLRPLPGGARMYPETDVPPLRLDHATLERIRAHLPETMAQKLERFPKQFRDLSEEQARQIVRGEWDREFEALVKATGLVKEAARLLLSTTPELIAKGVPAERITQERMLDALTRLKEGAFAKEALPAVVETMVMKGLGAAQAVQALGLGGIDKDALRREVDEEIAKNAALVAKQGLRAAGPLMGPIMARHKGKVSGQEISALLQERLQAWLAAHPAD
jgi:glutamyl-tRNA(Gln) amidotransferase subunit E